MADTKAEEALKDAESNNIKIKVYYSGKTPAESFEFLKYNSDETPLLFKAYSDRFAMPIQFVNSLGAYNHLCNNIKPILDAAIVNNSQKEALWKLITNVLADYLTTDRAQENEIALTERPY